MIEESQFSNKEIAHLLRCVAGVYLLKNELRFKVIAYEKAADAVEHLTRELKDIWEEGKIYKVPGIGASIGQHLDEYFRTGRSRHFESVLKKIPASVFILMKIPNIGPKKAFRLVTAFGLKNPATVVEDLKKICLEGKVASLPTFGAKSQEDILNSIKIFEQREVKTERMPLPYAFSLADRVINYIKRHPDVKKVDVLGSLRRMVATIGDIDIAVQAKNGRKVIKYFIDYPKKISVDNAGERKASIIVAPNVRIDLRVQDEKTYGSMLQYLTGSKAHNINLREYALRRGYSLSEYGIKEVKVKNRKPKIHEFSSEEDFYRFLGLQYIEPELREGTNEIELAEKKQLPKLVEPADIKGDLHLHSSFDLKPAHDLGANNYQEILEYAGHLGYEYVGFADHNPKISDLTEGEIIEILKIRQEKIKQLEAGKKIKFFIGLEVDILPDGRLSLPEKAVDYLDYLIVAVHSSFRQDIEMMTKRVIRALDHPKVKILAHPTGRLLGKREGFELEWTEIFKLCQKKKIALEINAWPLRLDLPDTLVREALSFGARFVVNTDAHTNFQMDNMFYGVAVARRGWCKKSDIINTLAYNKFKEWLLND